MEVVVPVIGERLSQLVARQATATPRLDPAPPGQPSTTEVGHRAPELPEPHSPTTLLTTVAQPSREAPDAAGGRSDAR